MENELQRKTNWNNNDFKYWIEHQDKNINVNHVLELETTIIPTYIDKFVNLTRLYISDNKITTLPDTIGNLTNLLELNITISNITSLPDTIGNLTKLTKLYISRNKLTSLPDSISNLTKLIRLHIDDNKFTSLPDTICNLNSLVDLSISNNRLTSLPDNFGNLNMLITLNISNNRLTSLPDSIGNLNKLRDLNIANNQLTSLPDTIGNLNTLTTLTIFNNQLTTLPDSILNLHNLVDFTIDPVLLNTLDNEEIIEFIENIQIDEEEEENEEQDGVAFEIHNAFAKINKDALFKFIISKLEKKPRIIDNNRFITYINDTLTTFIKNIKDNKIKKETQDDFNTIYKNIISKITYKTLYIQIIMYMLEYVKKQPDDFKDNYIRNFTYDSAHAYNGENPISCSKGIIERFVTSVIPSIMLYIDTPIFKTNEYDKLLSILENKSLENIKDLITQYSQECYEASEGDKDKFRECIKEKARDIFKNSYNNASTNAELNTFIPALGLFDGGKRKLKITKRKTIRRNRNKTILKTARKRKIIKGNKRTQKLRKIKIKKTQRKV